MFKTQWIWGCIFAFTAGLSFAANPFTVTLSPPEGFGKTVKVGEKSTVRYTITNNNAPATGTIVPTALPAPGNEFSFGGTCASMSVARGASCVLEVNLVPTSPGVKSIQITIKAGRSTYEYSALTTMAIEDAGVASIKGSVEIPLPEKMKVGEDPVLFKFRFENTGTAPATGIAVTSPYASFSPKCPSTLPAKASCTAEGSFTPTGATLGKITVTGTLVYNQGNPEVVSTSTMVEAEEKGIKGELIEGLPPFTQVNVSHTVKVKFTNEMSRPVNVTQSNVFTSGAFRMHSDTCPGDNAPFNPGASCTIEFLYKASKPGKYSFESNLIPQTSPPPKAVVSTSTTVLDNTSSSRNIYFENQCPFDVWYTLNGDAIEGSHCTTDDDCKSHPGSVCSITAQQCYWANNYPADQGSTGYRLEAYGGDARITLPDLGGSEVWKGAVSASTGCDESTSSCKTGGCTNQGGKTSCAPGSKFEGPTTKGHITLLKTGADTYFVDVINGFHIPVAISTNKIRKASGYSCSMAGSPDAQGGSPNTLGACIWDDAPISDWKVEDGKIVNINLPQQNFFRVTSGPACNPDNTCAGDKICGYDDKMTKACGSFLGFWTAKAACEWAPKTAPFQCETKAVYPAPDEGLDVQLGQLYACVPPDPQKSLLNSCYLEGADNTCCGCANWQNIIPIITLQSNEKCKNPNPAPEASNPDPAIVTPWSKAVMSNIKWMKKACPTYAVYPFDSASSTFTCTDATPVDYTVTFCAGGSGERFKKADGRY